MAQLREAVVSVDQQEAPMARPPSFGTDFLPGNPFRPPDWRWQRAGQLLERGARRRRQDDDRVVRTRRFRADLAGVRGDVRHPRLARAHPEALGAYLLHQGDPRRRWEVEARLLAGQGDGEIAGHVGDRSVVIKAFEALFFDVRGRLESSDWVSACVLGAGLYEGFDAGDTETLWKVLAYHGGPVILDALIDSAQSGGQPAANPELVGQLELLVTATTMPVTPEHAPGILQLEAWLRRFERAEAARSVAMVTRPVSIRPSEIPFGLEVAPLVYTGCAPEVPFGNDLASKCRSVDLSDAG